MDLLQFIKNFKENNPDAIEDCFMNGNCYWFAQILETVTENNMGLIVYDPILNHFYFYYIKTNKFYDIRGEVHPDFNDVIAWETYRCIEPLDANRVIKNCILKEY